jgi:hypothetical protein
MVFSSSGAPSVVTGEHADGAYLAVGEQFFAVKRCGIHLGFRHARSLPRHDARR